jgi:ubiquinone/menaquinone biosynthesis C-methylase UbiE
MADKKTFWDRFAFAYDAAEVLNKKAYRNMLENVVALTPNNAKVLECAAGTGAISVAVASKAKKVLCTDLSLPMLEQAKRKTEKQGLSNISFAERNLLSLPDDDSSYDVVIAANVVHLLPDPHVALSELWRVTRSGGVLIVPTFLTHGSKKGFSFLIKCYELLGFRPAHNYTETMYHNMLVDSGLPLTELKVLDGKVPVGFAVFRKAQGTA